MATKRRPCAPSARVERSIALPPIEDRLDLHHFQPKEVRPLLDDYLESSSRRGFQEILIIHGKGRGVLKQRVRSILSNHPLVVCYRDAGPAQGGWGATLVTLAPFGSAFNSVAGGEIGSAESPEPGRTGFRWQGLLFGFFLGLAAAGLLLIWFR